MIARALSALLTLLLLNGPASADVGSTALVWSPSEAPYEVIDGIYMDVDPNSCPGINWDVTEYQFTRYDSGNAIPAFTSPWQGDDGYGNNYLDTAVVAQFPGMRHNYKACCRSNVTQTGGGCTQIYPLLNSMDGIGYGSPGIYVISANLAPVVLGTTWIRAKTTLARPKFFEKSFPFKYRWKWGKLSVPFANWTISSPVTNNWRDFTSADGIQPDTDYCFISEVSDSAGVSSGFLPSTSGQPGGALCVRTWGSRTETLRWTQAASPAPINGYEVDYGTTTSFGTVENLQLPVPALGQYTKNITVNSGVTLYFVIRAYSGTYAAGRRSANSNMLTRPFP